MAKQKKMLGQVKKHMDEMGGEAMRKLEKMYLTPKQIKNLNMGLKKAIISSKSKIPKDRL